MVTDYEVLAIIRKEVGEDKFRKITKSPAAFMLWVKMMVQYRDRYIAMQAKDSNDKR